MPLLGNGRPTHTTPYTTSPAALLSASAVHSGELTITQCPAPSHRSTTSNALGSTCCAPWIINSDTAAVKRVWSSTLIRYVDGMCVQAACVVVLKKTPALWGRSPATSEAARAGGRSL